MDDNLKQGFSNLIRLENLVLLFGTEEDLDKIREITRDNTAESLNEAVLYMENKIAPR